MAYIIRKSTICVFELIDGSIVLDLRNVTENNFNQLEIAKTVQLYLDNLQQVINKVIKNDLLSDIFAATVRSCICL
ncbi:MAG: hypothetical protein U9N55_10100 [candidate division Zixibacteria bacterium]|nr:hypothetical protein [candidate division Zixibacteria bacterium]